MLPETRPTALHALDNLLSVVLGKGEILLATLGPQDERREVVREVMLASTRAYHVLRDLAAPPEAPPSAGPGRLEHLAHLLDEHRWRKRFLDEGGPFLESGDMLDLIPRVTRDEEDLHFRS